MKGPARNSPTVQKRQPTANKSPTVKGKRNPIAKKSPTVPKRNPLKNNRSL
jgi:hypothetical protein